VVIGTKVSPAHVQPAVLPQRCEASLRRLATDHVDLYMVHWPITLRSIRHFDAGASVCPAVDDAFATLLRLRDEGKVRHIGVTACPVRRRRCEAHWASYAPCAATTVTRSPSWP
jgi:diketogulonate reductase-like aldo/keto reductase